MKDEEPKSEGGGQMIEGAEAVDSAGTMEAELGHKASADDHGNFTQEEVPPSASAEKKKEGRNRDHTRR